MRINLPELGFPRLWRGLAGLLTAVVVVLSLMPHPPQPPGILAWDKAQHFTAYAALAGVWLQAVSGRRPVAVLVGLVGLGILLEGLQAFSVFRTTDLLDALANTVGVGLGTALCFTPLGRILYGADRLCQRVRG